MKTSEVHAFHEMMKDDPTTDTFIKAIESFGGKDGTIMALLHNYRNTVDVGTVVDYLIKEGIVTPHIVEMSMDYEMFFPYTMKMGASIGFDFDRYVGNIVRNLSDRFFKGTERLKGWLAYTNGVVDLDGIIVKIEL